MPTQAAPKNARLLKSWHSATAGTTFHLFVKAIRETSARPSFYGFSVASLDVLNTDLGPAAQGIILAQIMPSLRNTSIPVVAEYLKLLKERGPEAVPSASQFDGFVHAKVLVEGLQRAGRNLSTDSFIKAMEASGEIAFGRFTAQYSPSSHIGSTQAYVLQTLAELRAADDVIVEEAPTARVQMHEHLPILRPQTFYTMASGGLGYGMPAAAGIALARPGRKVICVIGDGSAMYSIQTLWTAVQLRLDVTDIVLNNRKYGAMKRFGGVLGFPADACLPGTDLPGLDFVALAQGHGCAASRVASAQELRGALHAALNNKGPTLLEVLVA